MEHIYNAYKKDVQGVTTYFVKKLRTFPDLMGVPDIMEGFGMHADFTKACNIAGITQPDIINQLLAEVNETHMPAKVIQFMAPGISVNMNR